MEQSVILGRQNVLHFAGDACQCLQALHHLYKEERCVKPRLVLLNTMETLRGHCDSPCWHLLFDFHPYYTCVDYIILCHPVQPGVLGELFDQYLTDVYADYETLERDIEDKKCIMVRIYDRQVYQLNLKAEDNVSCVH